MSDYIYKVILKAEDGDYVLKETSSQVAAYRYARKKQSSCGDGQRVEVSSHRVGWGAY